MKNDIAKDIETLVQFALQTSDNPVSLSDAQGAAQRVEAWLATDAPHLLIRNSK
jgi:hypothetical protein